MGNTVSTTGHYESSLFNLKEIKPEEINKELLKLFVKEEKLIQAFKTVRDQVIFTTKRIIVINVQGITGKKTSYISYPYKSIIYYGIQTAGVLDIDSELFFTMRDGSKLLFDFSNKVDIRNICRFLNPYIL